MDFLLHSAAGTFNKSYYHKLKRKTGKTFSSLRMGDLDKYKEKINQVEDSSLDSTARTLALLNEVGG